MAKVLTISCDLERLSEVNRLFREKGHPVRGANCPSTMRHLLALEPFQFIVILDPLPLGFSEALRRELRAGRISPRVLDGQAMTAEEIVALLAQHAHPQRAQAA